MATTLAPSVALAQGIPTNDTQGNIWWGAQLAQRILEAYKFAREWRDVALAKAQAMFEHTRKLTALRRKLENRAIGELGRLGEHIPDWREYANYCTIDVRGVTLCNVDSYINRKFEDVLHNTYYSWQSGLFGYFQDIRYQVHQILGAAYDTLADLGLTLLFGQPDTSVIYLSSSLGYTAEQSFALERAAEHLNIVLDSIMLEEVQGKEISSSRAQQLTAHLAYVEAVVELELLRSSISVFQTQVLNNAEKIKVARRRSYVKANSMPQ